MGDQINPKIVGATIIGFALVGGAYTMSNFGESHFQSQVVSQPASVGSVAPPRVSIAVDDKDQNGLEDWRDSFFTTETTTFFEPNATYTLPDTLTGKTGVLFMEGIINSKIYAPFAPSGTELVKKTANSLDAVATSRLSTIDDIDVMEEWDNEDIKNYANTLATVVVNNSVQGLKSEVQILSEVVRTQNKEGIANLVTISDVYKKYKEESLKIPVPKEFAKAHLDLINSYQVIHEDVLGMSKFIDDPLLSLIHIKRYSADADGLVLSLANMYKTIEPHASLFGKEDPALIFGAFSPDLKLNN